MARPLFVIVWLVQVLLQPDELRAGEVSACQLDGIDAGGMEG